MWHMPNRAVYCPIVYNTLEDWKLETGLEMTVLAIFLALALLLAVGLAAFQWSEARRWRQTAEETRAQLEQNSAALQEARHLVIQKDAEAAMHREIAESQLRLLTQTHQQVEERFRSWQTMRYKITASCS